MAYSVKVVDHYENPRNVGSFDNVGKRSSAPPAALPLLPAATCCPDDRLHIVPAATKYPS